MGATNSCLKGARPPNVVLKVNARCCNKTVKIHIDDTEKIRALLQYVQELSSLNSEQET